MKHNEWEMKVNEVKLRKKIEFEICIENRYIETKIVN